MEKINKIISLLENNQHEEAMKHYQQILQKGHNDDRFHLGEKLLQLGFLEEAKLLFERLLKTYPEEGELLVLLAETLMELGDEEQAILELEKIHENDPSYPQGLLLLADLYQMEGLYEVCERKLLMAKEKLPDEIIIDFALGEFYSEQGRFLEAIDAYKKVLEEKDELASVSINERLAEALSAGGAFEEALPFYEKSLSQKLEINTLFNYGLTALQAGQTRTAIEKLTELKELDPEYHSLYLYLAKAYEKEEELTVAYQTVLEGIKQDDFNKDLFFCAGKLALKTGKETEAEQHFREAIVLDPEFSEAALTLNKILLKQERYEDVLEIVQLMEAEDVEEPQFLWDAAIAFWHTEEFSLALNKYQLAYTYFKNDVEFLSDYGYFLIEEGKREDAAEIFSKLLNLDPLNEEYQDILQRLTENM
ncbi:lipopolysaccharide assembly protein LapB [Bacillus sp. 03113]|uniref:tetratricopeptide repeat protein n=1 Tax=Bacillus sp. 03113 TaxID=2578211 RepID=UPI0011446B3F|nr:tetratricopeptide repeat protein [Bacillus sp. 03113]